MQPTPDQIAIFRRLFLHHRPPHQAWMQPAGAASKYRKKHHAITDVELAAHLAGRLTLAAPLIGSDGLASMAALDIDEGGESALRQALTAAHQRSLTAFAVTSTSAAHDGGHVWLLFDQPTEAERLRRLVTELAQAAAVQAETYPSAKTIRLPLGIHRGTGRRGCVLLPGEDEVDLDITDRSICNALRAIAALPHNPIAQLRSVQPPAPVSARRAHQPAPGGTPLTITGYNQATDLVGLLEGYGGRVVEQYGDGAVLMRCPCGQHRHGDAHPSLAVTPATNPRYGLAVAYGFTPGCVFHTDAGQVVDAFGVYCRLERLTPAQAITRLARGRALGWSARDGGRSHAPSPMLPVSMVEEGGVR